MKILFILFEFELVFILKKKFEGVSSYNERIHLPGRANCEIKIKRKKNRHCVFYCQKSIVIKWSVDWLGKEKCGFSSGGTDKSDWAVVYLHANCWTRNSLWNPQRKWYNCRSNPDITQCLRRQLNFLLDALFDRWFAAKQLSADQSVYYIGDNGFACRQ